jgi:RND family efflux transporter MFP subunit
MKSIRIVFLFLAIAFIMGFVIISPAESQAPPPSPVVIAKVEEQKVQRPVTLVGNAEPSKTSLIASEVPGLVESFPIKEGDFVKKGDVLAIFETKPLEIRLREARAAKREAQARYELAQKNFKRFQELKNKGIASVQQFQDAESEQKAWSAEISQLQAQIDRYEYDLNKAKIVAPFSGYVTSERTEVGQWIEEGGPVVELIDIDTIEITVDAPERYVSQIKSGDEVEVNFDALPNAKLEGSVSSIVPQADKAARTFPVKIVIDNKDHLIKSGMVARVSFLIGEPTLVKLVPKDAVVERNNLKFVVIVNNGTAQPVQVNTGIAYKNLIEVIGPVNIGQPVVIRGNERLQPGQPVKVVNQDGMPEKK